MHVLLPETTLKSAQFLRNPGESHLLGRPRSVATEKNQEDKKTFERDFIACKACGHEITRNSEKIIVNSAHQHTFANPNGIVFDIGCFKSAPGCRHTGPFTPEFSWFSGYRWQISVCGSCLTHLGWLFASTENNFFYGLILDRLIESRFFFA
jgi:hypothetical protein